MSWLNPFVSRKGFDPIAFEHQLKKITNAITLTERAALAMESNHRRVRLLFNVYSWLLYVVGIAYTLYNTPSIQTMNLTHGMICVVSPFFILAMRKALKRYHLWSAARIQTRLALLREQHEAKIDNLKEMTNFNTTHDLLRKFGDGEDYDLMAQEEAALVAQQQERLTRLKQLQLDGKLDPVSLEVGRSRRTWGDKAMDLLLGGEEANATSQYALICHNCLKHNGLAPPRMVPDEVKYSCPNCGAANPQRPQSSDSPVLAGEEAAPVVLEPLDADSLGTGFARASSPPT